jgi:hypothetical protein
MRRSEWSDVKVGDLLNLRVENYAYSGKPHPRTAAELAALAARFGDRFEMVRDAPWQFMSRTTETGREFVGGCLGVVVSTVDDVTIRVHRNDLHVPRPPDVFPAPRALRVVTPHPEPAKRDPPTRKPWADNQRVGSIYVEQEPGGTVMRAVGQRQRSCESRLPSGTPEVAGGVASGPRPVLADRSGPRQEVTHADPSDMSERTHVRGSRRDRLPRRGPSRAGPRSTRGDRPQPNPARAGDRGARGLASADVAPPVVVDVLAAVSQRRRGRRPHVLARRRGRRRRL